MIDFGIIIKRRRYKMKKMVLAFAAISIIPSVASAKLYGDTPDA